MCLTCLTCACWARRVLGSSARERGLRVSTLRISSAGSMTPTTPRQSWRRSGGYLSFLPVGVGPFLLGLPSDTHTRTQQTSMYTCTPTPLHSNACLSDNLRTFACSPANHRNVFPHHCSVVVSKCCRRSLFGSCPVPSRWQHHGEQRLLPRTQPGMTSLFADCHEAVRVQQRRPDISTVFTMAPATNNAACFRPIFCL